MLRKKPKEKDRVKVPIPEDLRSALQEAWYVIQESERDPDVRVDYDDAIQVLPWLLGGRCGDKKRPFQFTYSVAGDRQQRWHLAFHPTEIEDIADGVMTEIPLYCCRTPGCGHKTSDLTFLCKCDFEDDPYFGHIAVEDMAEALARRGVTGITNSSTKDEIVASLGSPNQSGGDFKDKRHGSISPWIKFLREDCQLHFQFMGGKLEKLTIMEADWQPAR